MRARILGIALLVALLSCTAALADIVTSSTSGADWQTWAIADLNNNGNPYWDGASNDAANDNVGDCIANTGNCHMPGAPGVIPYWGLTSGAADPSFYLTQSVPTSNAALKIEIAGNASINQFGWYDTSNPGTLNLIFAGAAGAGASAIFTPSATYGFWFTGTQGTYYTQSSSLGADPGFQHFAIFQGSMTPGREVYWLGMEDLNYNYSGSDNDFQDMIVQVSAVPDGGVTLMLLGGALVGLETLRRRFRA